MSKLFLYSAICMTLPALQGCYSQEQLAQIDWKHKVAWVNSTVEEAAAKCPLVANCQLISLIGKPDFKFGPLELRDMLPANDAYRARVMAWVWDAYRRSKRGMKGVEGISDSDRWEDCEEFKRCSLWLYDESQHFRVPLDTNFWECLFCGKWGFTCYVIIVEGSDAIGGVGVILWEPLPSSDARP